VLKPIIDFDFWGLPIYWIMLLIGFLFAFISLKKKQQPFWCPPIIRKKTRRVFMLAAVVSFACANIIGWVLHPEYLRLPISDRFMLAGFSFYYAAIGFLAASALLLRVMRLNVKFWLDQIVPSILILNIFGRIGCMLAGCCYGADITMFGFTFTFPSRELEALTAIVMFIVFSKKVTQHRVFWYLSCYSFLRFMLEFGRTDDRGVLFINWLSPAQVTSIIVWIGLAVYIAIMKFTLKKNPFEKYNEFAIKNEVASHAFKPMRYKFLKRLLAFVLIGAISLTIWNPLQITALDSAKYSVLNIVNRVGATRSSIYTIAEIGSTSIRKLEQERVTSAEEALAMVQKTDHEAGGIFNYQRQEQLANGNQLYTFHQEYNGKPIFNSGRQLVVAPDNTASYMAGETIPLFNANSPLATNYVKSGSQEIKNIFGDNITVKTTTEGYYFNPAALMTDPLRNVEQIVFELANGTTLNALVDRSRGDIITLAPGEQTVTYNATLSNIKKATEGFLDSKDFINAAETPSDLQTLSDAFAAILHNKNIDNEAFANILNSSLIIAESLAMPNLSLYREILLHECKSYYINHGQSEREAQRRANVVDRALKQTGIGQVNDEPTLAITMADTAVKTKGSINYPGNSDTIVLTADAGRAQTFNISTSAPVIVTVMDETDAPVFSIPIERAETFKLYPINDSESFHIIISDNPLASGLGDYSISIQPDRAAEQRESVPGYITTKLRQIESAYNTSSVSRFVSQVYFLDSGDDSLVTTFGMTGLASVSSFVMNSCYSCVGLDEELLDGDKMMIAQMLFINNNLPDEIAASLKDTYLTLNYERHVEHENGSYVKATIEIGMLNSPPILKDVLYMEIRHIDNRLLAKLN